MSVQELCNREVVTVSRDATVMEAAARMREEHVGSVVVVEETGWGKRVPVGIVTDRDLVVEVMATGLDAEAITVGDIMAPVLVTAPASADLLPTLGVMKRNAVRRIPLVDDNGEVVGIVTVDDLMAVMTEQLRTMTEIVAREQAREARTRA